MAVDPDKLNAFTGKEVCDIGAAKHVKKTLAPDGTWMIVGPLANDSVEDNLNPMGRVFYAALAMICAPGINGSALGTQAGEARLHDVVRKGGLKRFRRATQTPFNLLLEARHSAERADNRYGRFGRS